MTAELSSANRIYAIDFVKGVLVVLMVVYHALNYLDAGTIPHDYLGFLPAAFITITGFLVVQAYSHQRNAAPRANALRLAARSVKLISLFTVLNVAAHMVWTRDRYGADMGLLVFFGNWEEVYLKGAARGVAFDVLLPIAYTLLISIALLQLASRSPRALAALAVGSFTCCTLLATFGWSTNNLNLISAGVIGVALGAFGVGSLNRLVQSPASVAAAAATYVVVLLGGVDTYATQTLTTLACLMILYALACAISSQDWLSRQVSLLGRYSLIGYIVQIVYLQGSHLLLLHNSSPLILNASILSVTIAILTWLTVVCVESMRPKYKMMDRAYKLLFA
jgi:hypothetical protein